MIRHFVTVQPPSTDQTILNDSAGIDSISRHTLSVYSSAFGLTSGNGTHSSGNGTHSSDPSVTTSTGINALPNIKARALAIDNQGLMTIPGPILVSSPRYECPFDRIGCLLSFSTFDSWYEHSLKHFRVHGPPSRNSCCFCTETFDEMSGIRSWKNRLAHVKIHHDQGERLATSRCDTELYRYMWSKNLISTIQYKDLTAGSVALTPGVAIPHGSAANSNTHLTANDGLRRNRGRHT